VKKPNIGVNAHMVCCNLKTEKVYLLVSKFVSDEAKSRRSIYRVQELTFEEKIFFFFFHFLCYIWNTDEYSYNHSYLF